MRVALLKIIALALINVASSSIQDESRVNDCDVTRQSNGRTEEYMIMCPEATKDSVHIQYKKENSLYVQCQTNGTSLMDLKFNFDVKSAKFEDCNVTSVKDVLVNWNIAGLKDIHLNRVILSADGVLPNDYFGEQPSVESLKIENCNLRDMEDESLSGFGGLKQLDLMRNKLREVPAAFRRVFPNLTRLDLNSNLLERLPDEMNAPKLKIFYAHSNQMEAIRDGTFANSTNVTLIELSANKLKYIPADLLRPLKNLKMVSFGLGETFEVPDDFFTENKNLEEIRFYKGNLNVTPGCLRNLTNLKSLMFSNCNVTTLPSGIFDDLTNLEMLNMMENNVEELPDDIFVKLTKLKRLSMYRNKLKVWRRTYFRLGAENLSDLNLESNELEVIEEGGFSEMKKLEKLSLKNNKLSRIPADAFDFNCAINHLDLSHNQLTESDWQDLPNLFNFYKYDFANRLTKVSTVLLNNNLYDTIPQFLGTNVNYFDMRRNNLTVVNLNEINKYKRIDLSDNKIKYVLFEDLLLLKPADGKTMSEFEVDLSGNKIKCDCISYNLAKYFNRTFDKVIEQKLHIIANNVTCDELGGLAITKLTPDGVRCNADTALADGGDVDYDCPRNCTCEFYPINRTINIDCSGKGFTDLPDISSTKRRFLIQREETRFNYNFVVEKYVVDLSYNDLNRIEKNNLYENVTALLLAGNRIRGIDWVPPNLEVLELNGNQFSSINSSEISLLEGCEKLRRLRLDDNPWMCDCDLTALVKSKLEQLMPYAHPPSCDTGEMIFDLKESDLCNNQLLIYALGSLLIIFLLTIMILIILYYNNEENVKLWLFTNKIFLQFIVEEDAEVDKKYDAYVSYEQKDEKFVVHELVPQLERCEDPYRLCIPIRDFEVGTYINRQMIESIDASKRTIVVLSKNYAKNAWALTEFRIAHDKAMTEHRNSLIFVLYDDVDSNDIDDKDLRSHLKMNGCLKWGEPMFWERLRYALPHKVNNRCDKKKKATKTQQKIDDMMISIDEKIDLTATSTAPNLQTPPALSADPLLLKGNRLEFSTVKVEDKADGRNNNFIL